MYISHSVQKTRILYMRSYIFPRNMFRPRVRGLNKSGTYTLWKLVRGRSSHGWLASGIVPALSIPFTYTTVLLCIQQYCYVCCSCIGGPACWGKMNAYRSPKASSCSTSFFQIHLTLQDQNQFSVFVLMRWNCACCRITDSQGWRIGDVPIAEELRERENQLSRWSRRVGTW